MGPFGKHFYLIRITQNGTRGRWGRVPLGQRLNEVPRLYLTRAVAIRRGGAAALQLIRVSAPGVRTGYPKVGYCLGTIRKGGPCAAFNLKLVLVKLLEIL